MVCLGGLFIDNGVLTGLFVSIGLFIALGILFIIADRMGLTEGGRARKEERRRQELEAIERRRLEVVIPTVREPEPPVQEVLNQNEPEVKTKVVYDICYVDQDGNPVPAPNVPAPALTSVSELHKHNQTAPGSSSVTAASVSAPDTRKPEQGVIATSSSSTSMQKTVAATPASVVPLVAQEQRSVPSAAEQPVRTVNTVPTAPVNSSVVQQNAKPVPPVQ